MPRDPTSVSFKMRRIIPIQMKSRDQNFELQASRRQTLGFKVRHAFMLSGLVWIMLSWAPVASAALFVDFNFLYLNDSTKVDTTGTNTSTLMDFAIGYDVDKKGEFQLGWAYSTRATSSGAGTPETYASTEMGPQFKWYFTKDRTWSIHATYLLIGNATFKALGGGAEQKWRGSGYKVDFGYGAPLSENFRLGMYLVYHTSNFNERVTGSTLDTIAYSRTFMLPMVHMSYRF